MRLSERREPYSARKVESGTATYMSRGWPNTEPSALPTPMTWNGWPSMRIVWPSGFESRKQFLGHVGADKGDVAAGLVFALR